MLRLHRLSVLLRQVDCRPLIPKLRLRNRPSLSASLNMKAFSKHSSAYKAQAGLFSKVGEKLQVQPMLTQQSRSHGQKVGRRQWLFRSCIYRRIFPTAVARLAQTGLEQYAIQMRPLQHAAGNHTRLFVPTML